MPGLGPVNAAVFFQDMSRANPNGLPLPLSPDGTLLSIGRILDKLRAKEYKLINAVRTDLAHMVRAV